MTLPMRRKRIASQRAARRCVRKASAFFSIKRYAILVKKPPTRKARMVSTPLTASPKPL